MLVNIYMLTGNYAVGVSQPLVTSYSACYQGNKDTHTRYSHHSTLCAQFPSDGSKAIRWVAEKFLPVRLSAGVYDTPPGIRTGVNTLTALGLNPKAAINQIPGQAPEISIQGSP